MPKECTENDSRLLLRFLGHTYARECVMRRASEDRCASGDVSRGSAVCGRRAVATLPDGGSTLGCQTGRPDLNAPVPKTADGKPDLSGMWENLGWRN